MTDKKSIESRRKLLKSIAAGSGAVVAGKNLPENWARPIVDSVMLPAHAQTSGGPFAGAAETRLLALEPGSIFAQVEDALVPQAMANNIPTNPYVCVVPNAAGDRATVTLYFEWPNTLIFTFNDVPVGGQSCSYTDEFPCDLADAGDLLEKFGLIKDAYAKPNVCCNLISVQGVGAGNLVFTGEGIIFDFSVGPSECNSTINCPL